LAWPRQSIRIVDQSEIVSLARLEYCPAVAFEKLPAQTVGIFAKIEKPLTLIAIASYQQADPREEASFFEYRGDWKLSF